ncbi:unnamed protein product [Candidula unifasciata]|uniref:G-protein coupled receptors family 1 profile domain-containing protein n=1 Tax=Candidula unifasciata TaxID=100452 RepID=A0A8S4A3C9_9EUPU|nr:unnamed protein product [Candidula unifasciata]
MNRSTAGTFCSASPWLNVIYCTAGSLIVFENVLMIVVIIRTPGLHNIANILVTSLSVTDAIVGFIAAMAGILFAVLKPSDWIFRYIYISVAATILGTTLCSHLHIAAIAIDRYIYIAHPFFYFRHVNEKVVFRCLLGVWFLVSLYTLASALSIKTRMFCLMREVMDLYISYVGSWITLFLLCLTSAAYFRIAAISLRHRRSIASVNIAALPSTNPSQPGNDRVSISEETWTHMLKTVRFFVVMTGSFAAMMVPVTICNFLFGHVQLSKTLLNTVTMLPILQSGFNFFINIFMNSDFRQAVVQVFLCRSVI